MEKNASSEIVSKVFFEKIAEFEEVIKAITNIPR